MVRRAALGVGRLGVRLALAFLALAFASIIVLSLLTELSTGRDVSAFMRHRQLAQARSVAGTVGSLYRRAGDWPEVKLGPIVSLLGRQGESLEIRDRRGWVVAAGRTSRLPAEVSRYKVPVMAGGQRIGSATLIFHSPSLDAAVRHLESERLRASLTAAGIVALLALAVAFPVSREITLPLERVMASIRARGAGDSSARVTQLPRAGVVREVGVALNEASDAVDERDRHRRDLVANIAHELRTPVAILHAGHQSMLDGVSPMVPENVASLQEEVHRLARMIDDLQQLAAAEAASVQLRLTPQDLSEVAADAADSLAESFSAAGVRLDRRLAGTLVRCDQDRMREVVTNLLTNACKFTPSGGAVLLSTRRDPGGLAVLTVADTGVGIPPEDLPRVTERFFRGRRAAGMSGGSGIGLAIVTELVRAHQGSVSIESHPGEGTRVTVTLPPA